MHLVYKQKYPKASDFNLETCRAMIASLDDHMQGKVSEFPSYFWPIFPFPAILGLFFLSWLFFANFFFPGYFWPIILLLGYFWSCFPLSRRFFDPFSLSLAIFAYFPFPLLFLDLFLISLAIFGPRILFPGFLGLFSLSLLFLAYFHPPSTYTLTLTLTQVTFEQFKKMWMRLMKWAHAYNTSDIDCNGNMDQSEFATAMQKMGFQLSPEHVAMLMNKFQTREGVIQLDDFIQICCKARSAKYTFQKGCEGRIGNGTATLSDFINEILKT